MCFEELWILFSKIARKIDSNTMVWFLHFLPLNIVYIYLIFKTAKYKQFTEVLELCADFPIQWHTICALFSNIIVRSDKTKKEIFLKSDNFSKT